MKTTPSLTSYPLFPDWIFEGELPIDEDIVNAVLSEIQTSRETPNFQKASFGWITNKNIPLGKNNVKLNSLIGSMFMNNVAPHFRLNKQQCNKIEICESWLLGLNPSHNFPQSVHRHRWYHSVLFLKSQPTGSNLYFDTLGPKLFSSPPGVQPYEHIIPAKTNKVVFFPAHVPWGFTPNMSSSDSIIFCNSFIIKQ